MQSSCHVPLAWTSRPPCLPPTGREQITRLLGACVGKGTRWQGRAPGWGAVSEAGVRLARRNDFEGRTANCFSRCPPRGVLCLVAHVWDPSKDGQPHGPCQHGLMKKTPTSDPGSRPKNSLEKYCRSFLNLSDEEPMGSDVHKRETCLKTSFLSRPHSPQLPARFPPSSHLHPLPHMWIP